MGGKIVLGDYFDITNGGELNCQGNRKKKLGKIAKESKITGCPFSGILIICLGNYPGISDSMGIWTFDSVVS